MVRRLLPVTGAAIAPYAAGAVACSWGARGRHVAHGCDREQSSPCGPEVSHARSSSGRSCPRLHHQRPVDRCRHSSDCASCFAAAASAGMDWCCAPRFRSGLGGAAGAACSSRRCRSAWQTRTSGCRSSGKPLPQARVVPTRGSQGSSRSPRVWRGWVSRGARRRAAAHINLYVTNVPGPTSPLYFAGARLLEAVPLAPLVAGVRLSVTAISAQLLDGQFAVSLLGDDSVPDLPVLVRGVRTTFEGYLIESAFDSASR